MQPSRRLRLDLNKVAKQEDIPVALLAAVRQAIERGFTVADLVANLTPRGYEMVLVPHGSKAGIPLPLSDAERLEPMRLINKAKPSEVREGTAVQYAVPKPPGPTTYANAIVERLVREGVASLPNVAETVEAKPDDPVAVLRVYARANDKWNETDRRVLKPVSQLRVIDDFLEKVNKAVKDTLQQKVEDHNEQYGDEPGKTTDYRTLQAVFDRGVGAYRGNPSSVRPNVASAEQWAYGRVNGFLYALRTGRFRRTPYDTDLLPKAHRLSTRKSRSISKAVA
jgi:hypothetical protein